MLPRQFSQESGHGGMKFAHLQQHRAIFDSNIMHALYAAQDRDIERFCRAAGCKFHHLFRAVCRNQFAWRAESDRLAMIDNGYTIAKALSLVHVMRGEQDGAAGLLEFLDQFPELASSLRIESGGRFIEKKKIRIADQGTSQR